MLTQIRNLTRGWVAAVLVGLLALAFAIWGVNDVFSGVGGSDIAKVGNRGITAEELSRELDFVLRRQQDQAQPGQPPLSLAQAIESGAHLQVLNAMISRRAMQAYAERMGVVASPAQIADQIRAIPAAQNPITSTFDREAYEGFVRQLGYTPAQFEREVGGEIAANLMVGALASGARAPTSFGALALAFETERRVVAIAEAPASIVLPIPAPTEEELREMHRLMGDRFAVPEFRAATLVIARADDFLPRTTVSEQAIRAEFDAAAGRLAQPEKRSFVQITAPDQAKAEDAAARLGRGEAPAAAASAVGGQVVTYAAQAQAEIPDPQIAQAVFALPQGSAPRVVRGRLAPFAAVRLDTIVPAVTPSFEAERENIRARLAEGEAQDLLNAAVETFENARDEGRALSDAARAAGLTVVQIAAIDAQGRGPDGETPEALIDQGAVVETIFSTAEGETSDFVAGAGRADYMVEVTSVSPPTTRPLEQVREDVARAWTARETTRRLDAIGANVRQAVENGQSFEAAVRAQRGRVLQDSIEIDRRMAAQIPAQTLGGAVFSAPVGAVLSDMRLDGGALVLAQVKEVRRTDPQQDPQALAAAREAFQQQVRLSIAQAVEADVLRQIGSRTNEAALNRAFPRGTASEDDAAE